MIRLALLTMLMASQGAAQANCALRETVVEKLQSSYGEQLAGGGLQSQTRVFEVWVSTAKGTWTILMTRADGVSCIMASGSNWRDFPYKEIPEGEEG